MAPLEKLRYHVTGAIERGEKEPICEQASGMDLLRAIKRDALIGKHRRNLLLRAAGRAGGYIPQDDVLFLVKAKRRQAVHVAFLARQVSERWFAVLAERGV